MQASAHALPSLVMATTLGAILAITLGGLNISEPCPIPRRLLMRMGNVEPCRSLHTMANVGLKANIWASPCAWSRGSPRLQLLPTVHAHQAARHASQQEFPTGVKVQGGGFSRGILRAQADIQGCKAARGRRLVPASPPCWGRPSILP